MGTARVEVATINLIQSDPTPKIEVGSINLIYSEAALWEAFIATLSSISGTLSYEPPAFGTTQRWTWPVGERLTFDTEILQSHDRTEQRIAQRTGVPARTISTKLLVTGDNEYAQLETFLHAWLKSKARIPLWFEAERHTTPISAGASSISVDTRYADYRDGSAFLIWSSKNLYEYVYVDSFTDDQITLWGQTAYDHPGDKWIMPARLGYAVESINVERYHGGALVDISWLIEDIADVTGFSADMSYDGYTVITDPAHLPGDAGEISHDADLAVLDAGSGVFRIVSNSSFNITGQPHIWHPWTKADCWWLRQFFHDINGSQSPFLVPTFGADITLTRPVAGGSTDIYVANVGIANNMGVNAMRTYLAFRPDDADIIPRKITDAQSISATEEKLTLNTAPGVPFRAGDQLCWVDLCRLASDDIDWTWHRIGKATVSAPVVRVTG